ncbi:carboxymuconolactone decarboxylase family protein [Pseudorhodoplanes sp.]|uniref:carboxymuconolactone decarboxylase family protein n=1 Tax=Pseudorhodoplanes sp. TaxID=1934341 RepID=UPI00391BC7FF
MDQRTLPPPRLAPLPPETTPELKAQFDGAIARMGFIPNSMLIMQRDPALTRAFAQMSAAIWRSDSKVDLKLKRLISHVASRSAGCKYCMAHTAEGASKLGVDQQKLDEVWSYQTSPLYTAAERAALDVAVAAGCVPNAVTDEMFTELRKHWSEEQIVEIVGVIALFGFLNRWNDTFATPLEDEPLHFGEAHLAAQGWDAGKHRR